MVDDKRGHRRYRRRAGACGRSRLPDEHRRTAVAARPAPSGPPRRRGPGRRRRAADRPRPGMSRRCRHLARLQGQRPPGDRGPGAAAALPWPRGGFRRARAPRPPACRSSTRCVIRPRRSRTTLAHLDLYLEAFERGCSSRRQGALGARRRRGASGRARLCEGRRPFGDQEQEHGRRGDRPERGARGRTASGGSRPTSASTSCSWPARRRATSWRRRSTDQGADRGLFASTRHAARRRRAEALLAEARRELRQRYFEAEVGITGANFLIAETGSVVLVTNEGNAELTQGLPQDPHRHRGPREGGADARGRLHAAAGARALRDRPGVRRVHHVAHRAEAAGRPRRADGFHVVLVDNGRSAMIGSEFQEILRCIRCGACMNHCPVYLTAGGHAYGWVYPGPMGAVLTPSFIGIEQAHHPPSASTFCGRCEQVCPVRIPLPKLMRLARAQFTRGWSRRSGATAPGCGRSSPSGRRCTTPARRSRRAARPARPPDRPLPEPAVPRRVDRLARLSGTSGATFQALWRARGRPR